jgi:hypothetical protein
MFSSYCLLAICMSSSVEWCITMLCVCPHTCPAGRCQVGAECVALSPGASLTWLGFTDGVRSESIPVKSISFSLCACCLFGWLFVCAYAYAVRMRMRCALGRRWRRTIRWACCACATPAAAANGYNDLLFCLVLFSDSIEMFVLIVVICYLLFVFFCCGFLVFCFFKKLGCTVGCRNGRSRVRV